MRQTEQNLSGAAFSKFESMRMKLGWLLNTRPNIVLEMPQTAQISRAMHEKIYEQALKEFKERIKIFA